MFDFFYRAVACSVLTRDIDIAILSVCPSWCFGIGLTRRPFAIYSPVILVLWVGPYLTSLRNSDGVTTTFGDACVTNKSHYNCDYSTAQHYGFVPNLVLNPAVKEFRKSVNIWNSYCLTKNSSRFFETQCINKWKRFVCPFWAFDEQWIQFNERSKLVTVNSSRAKKQDGELVTDAKKMTVNSSQKIPCDEFVKVLDAHQYFRYLI